jgi:hypothetical protein
LKGKSLLLLALTLTLFVLCLPLLVKAQTDTTIWRDDMSYQSFDQLQAAGWTSEHADGVSFGSVGVILDQIHGDTAIHYGGHFAPGIYDWKVEDQSRWISGSHSGNDVSAITEKHNYAFAADGWYSQFAFYHDGSKVYTSQKGTYSESKGALFTLSMVKIGTQINCYFNGQLMYTYIESDSTPSQINGVDAVSPWGGSSEYDYFQLSSATVFPSSVSAQSDSILSNPFVVGGIVGGVGIGVGLGVYFGFFAGGSAASSAGAGSAMGSAGTIGGSGNLGFGSGGANSDSGLNSNAYAPDSGYLDPQGAYDPTNYNTQETVSPDSSYANSPDSGYTDPAGTYDPTTYNLHEAQEQEEAVDQKIHDGALDACLHDVGEAHSIANDSYQQANMGKTDLSEPHRPIKKLSHEEQAQDLEMLKHNGQECNTQSSSDSGSDNGSTSSTDTETSSSSGE